MVVWHNAHWATWGRQQFFDNIFPEVYESLLPSSLERARSMGWTGARYCSQPSGTFQHTSYANDYADRWPKMTETSTGGNSPGGINAVLMWQQVRAPSRVPVLLVYSNRVDFTATSNVPSGVSLPGITNPGYPETLGCSINSHR